jgi:hypothetical protein
MPRQLSTVNEFSIRFCLTWVTGRVFHLWTLRHNGFRTISFLWSIELRGGGQRDIGLPAGPPRLRGVLGEGLARRQLPADGLRTHGGHTLAARPRGLVEVSALSLSAMGRREAFDQAVLLAGHAEGVEWAYVEFFGKREGWQEQFGELRRIAAMVDRR